VSEGSGTSATRIVSPKGEQYRFLNFAGKNCRIEPMEGCQSFLALIHELFHATEQTRRITRESIIVRT